MNMFTHTHTGSNYFSSHYYLGHRKFECGDPELFLFGELADLNFLPDKPTSVSYYAMHPVNI